jgi:hypothetical protein
VEADVLGGSAQQLGIVAEETQPLVAPLAEQLSDLFGRVIVVEVLGMWLPADRTPVVLGRTDCCDLVSGESIHAIEVRVAACDALACLAPAG